MRRVPHALAWLVLFAGLGSFLMMPGVLGIAFTLGWGIVFALIRWIASTAVTRGSRLAIDIVALALCVLGTWEGGLFLVPAAIAFLLADLVAASPRLTGGAVGGAAQAG
jgi:hypothetical protein